MGIKPKVINKATVDGDLITYRASFATQDEIFGETTEVIDRLMDHIITQTVVFPDDHNLKVFLTGKGNHRYTIAKHSPYKGNRGDKPKPVHLEPARAYLQDQWGAVVTQGCEADDAIAIEHTMSDPEVSVIVSYDKDFNTIPGYKYNFIKDTWRYDTPEEALRFFYTQVLTGDASDNIIGLHGIGPVRAEKILGDSSDENELFQKCVDAYGGDLERVIENARLLHLQRRKDELWEPPE